VNKLIILEKPYFGLKDEDVVCTTPEASYWCKKNSINYKIPEDFFLWKETEEYKKWQLNWLLKLDNLLKKEYKDENWPSDMHMTYYCLTMWKNVLDAFARRISQFKKITEGYDEVLYIGGNGKDIVDDELYWKGKTLLARMVENAQNGSCLYENSIYKSKREYNSSLKSLYYFLREYRFLPSWKRSKILFASQVKGEIKKTKLRGYRVQIIKPMFGAFHCRVFKIHFLSSLIDGLADYFDCDKKFIDSIFGSRLIYYSFKIVPEILSGIDHYKKVFQKSKANVIVFNRRNQVYQYAALIAAKKVGMKTVYIRHGWDAYDSWIRKWVRFKPFDYFVATTDEGKEFYKKKVEEWGLETVVI